MIPHTDFHVHFNQLWIMYTWYIRVWNEKRNIFRGALWWQILISVKEYGDLMNGGDNFELLHTKNIRGFWGTTSDNFLTKVP